MKFKFKIICVLNHLFCVFFGFCTNTLLGAVPSEKPFKAAIVSLLEDGFDAERSFVSDLTPTCAPFVYSGRVVVLNYRDELVVAQDIWKSVMQAMSRYALTKGEEVLVYYNNAKPHKLHFRYFVTGEREMVDTPTGRCYMAALLPVDYVLTISRDGSDSNQLKLEIRETTSAIVKRELPFFSSTKGDKILKAVLKLLYENNLASPEENQDLRANVVRKVHAKD
jgi:hypothetical protein